MRTLSPELSLAAACAMWPPSAQRDAAIRAAATAPVRWERFLRVVKRHRVAGLVSDALARSDLGIPAELRAELNQHAAILARRNLALAAEAVRLQRLFDGAGITALFVKGATLAILAYGNLGLREGKDIDILVAHADVPAALAIIEAAGYRRFDPPADIGESQLQTLLSVRKDLGYVDPRGIVVELHWRLFSNPHFMSEDTAMRDSRLVPVAGTGGLRTLGEDDLFAYLCGHGTLHWWYQLKWLADVEALLGQGSDDRAKRLLHAADARGVGRSAEVTLALCHRLFGRTLPASLRLGRGVSGWLETTALRALGADGEASEPGERPFGTTRGSLSSFLLKSDMRYWLAELRLHLLPQGDVLAVSLPKSARFLYPLLRLPLWLWRHWARWDGRGI